MGFIDAYRDARNQFRNIVPEDIRSVARWTNPAWYAEKAVGQFIPDGSTSPGQPGQPQAPTQAQQDVPVPIPAPTSTYSDGSSGGGGWSASDERAYYNDQIASLDRLLGVTNSQYTAGLGRLGLERSKLGDTRTKTFNRYADQEVQNDQDKQKGVEGVDSFANNSYRSLMRLLQGANAGNSSVAREVVPYLVSKSAGTRRQGVFDQAGENTRNISIAKKDAEDEFGFAEDELKGQEKAFRDSILNKQNEIDAQKRQLQIQAAMADGTGYEAAKAAGDASQNSINARFDQLNSLFGQFAPHYRALNLQDPTLGKYTIDPAQIRADQNLPAESRYYNTQIRKRKEQEL